MSVNGRMLTVAAGTVGADDVLVELAALPGNTALAARRAARRIVGKLRTMSRGKLAEALKVPVQAISARYRVRGRADGAELWVGTYGVDAMQLGTPRQFRQRGGGTKVGQYFFRGAFTAAVYGYPGVFIRTGSQYYSPEKYPNFWGRYRQGRNTAAPSAGRFPVLRISVPIHDVVEVSLDGFDVEEAFRVRFQHELEYILRSGGAR